MNPDIHDRWRQLAIDGYAAAGCVVIIIYLLAMLVL